MMRECLDARGGEVSARMRAADLGQSYLELDREGRQIFLEVLAKSFDISPEETEQAIIRYQSAEEAFERLEAERQLRQAVEPKRVKLLTQFNALPEGVKFLVDLRSDLLSMRSKDPYLAALDDDLRSLLTSWFDVGFLDLRRITWKSPAALLEKLIAYEAVHEIQSWDDLRNRLDSDRRCYALFHPRMPDEPLTFVEVALVKGTAKVVQALLDEMAPVADPKDADTAIFYSISNTQKGLRGVSFGEHLIKGVVAKL
ncbi:MAG: malonyl-CoA decarboxylase family protein, partial [Pseudomonadota bacterium]